MTDRQARKLIPITGPSPVVSDFLGGIGRTKIYGLIESGDLARVNIGRRAFVTAASIDDYIERITGKTNGKDTDDARESIGTSVAAHEAVKIPNERPLP